MCVDLKKFLHRNGHGMSDPRLKPISEARYRNGSNSSVEYGDI